MISAADIIAEVCARHGIPSACLSHRVNGRLLWFWDTTGFDRVRLPGVRGEIIHRLRAERRMSYPECAEALGMGSHSSALGAHRRYLTTLERS